MPHIKLQSGLGTHYIRKGGLEHVCCHTWIYMCPYPTWFWTTFSLSVQWLGCHSVGNYKYICTKKIKSAPIVVAYSKLIKNVKTSSCLSLPVPMENNIDTSSTSMQGLLKIFLTSKRVDMGASTSCSTCISNSASSLAREDWHSPAPSSTLLHQERQKTTTSKLENDQETNCFLLSWTVHGKDYRVPAWQQEFVSHHNSSNTSVQL